MKHDLKSAAIGALGAILVLVLMGQAPMTIRTDGLQFPDGTEQTTAAATDTRRAFYLTTQLHQGSTARGACEDGYHMASLWEILDVSNLRYATEVADANTREDTGEGPPSALGGWVRTGYDSLSSELVPGLDNCNTWSSNTTGEYGSVAFLVPVWDGSTVGPHSPPDVDWLGPWATDFAHCSTDRTVWCVEGPPSPTRGG